jgi:hypothetical protein
VAFQRPTISYPDQELRAPASGQGRSPGPNQMRGDPMTALSFGLILMLVGVIWLADRIH